MCFRLAIGVVMLLASALHANANSQASAVPKEALVDPAGTYLPFCSVGGCLAGPHMFTQVLAFAATRRDGTAQEVGVAYNFVNQTGYAPNWVPYIRSIEYKNSVNIAQGQAVSSNRSIFKARSSCVTSAEGEGPAYYIMSGYGAPNTTGNNIPDGNCVFDYYGPSRYEAYTGVGSSTPNNVTEISASGNIYRIMTNSCQMAAGGAAPVGVRNSINGSCKLNYVGPALNDGKSGLSLASVMKPGGGNGWGRVENHVARPGSGSNVWYPSETDTNNENMDSYAGSPFFALAHFDGGGSQYTYPIFAYYYLGSGAVNSGSRNPYGAHYGFYCSGQPGDVGSVCKDAAYVDASNSSIGFQLLAGRTHAAGFEDDSDSSTPFKVVGKHSGHGLDLSQSADAGAGGTILLKIYAIASLPVCGAGTHAALAYVSDSKAKKVSWHGKVADGGETAYNGLVSCNGIDWVYD